ncbi:hypothetical protein Q3G72_028983 [Acer saccharum]|nr:hypothetical protein Q3G72_028983 [Acer saccharum]
MSAWTKTVDGRGRVGDHKQVINDVVINLVTLDFSLVDHDNGLGLQNLDPAQDTGLRSEGLLIDFLKNSDSSLEGEEFHIDLSGGPVSNRMGSSKVRKEGPRGRLQGREAKKIQLMMKKVFEDKSSPKLDWLTASVSLMNKLKGHRGRVIDTRSSF